MPNISETHLSQVQVKPTYSQFWKVTLHVFIEIYNNYCVKNRGGNGSFWFDKWLSSGPMATSGNVQNHRLTVKDCWVSTTCDSTKLIELVGVDKADEIICSNIQCKTRSDKFLWEPTFTGDSPRRRPWTY